MNFRKTPWRNDPRSKNFSHSRFFGAQPLRTKPLGRKRAPVLDQKQTLRCTGYGSAANGYYIHHVEMSPDWQAFTIGRIQGKSVDDNGGDPNATMKSMADYGFLPKTKAPFSLEDGIDASGYFANWPKSLDDEAKTWDLQVGFVRVDGPYDIFDNIWNALCMAYDEKTGRGAAVDAFGQWYIEWDADIIPTTYKLFAGWHRWIFVDKVWDHGTEYLLAQNSYGTHYGDRGFHLFPREVVNREFAKWGTSLKILKTLKSDQLEEAKKETGLGYAWRLLLQAWFTLTEKFGIFGSAPIALQSLYTQLAELLVKLQSVLQSRYTPPTDTKSRIQDWALGIQHAEGGKPHHLNMKLHNPGAFKYTPLTAELGALPGPTASDGGRFATWPTYQEGYQALCKFLTLACKGKLASYGPDMSIYEFTKTYAGYTRKMLENPANKQKLDNYVAIVTARTQSTPNTAIKELL